MPASKHMVVVEKRRILPQVEPRDGRNRGPKFDARYRPSESRARDARSPGAKASVSNDS